MILSCIHTVLILALRNLQSQYPLTKRTSLPALRRLLRQDPSILTTLIVLQLLFTRALASHSPSSSPVTIVSVNPGFCDTELKRNSGAERIAVMNTMYAEYGWTSEEGSRQLVYAALAGSKEGKDGEKMHGEYVSYSKVGEVSDWVVTEEGKEAEGMVWVSFSVILEVASRDAVLILAVYRMRRSRF